MDKKAYKVYNLVIKRIYYSRDVVCHENYFPFQHSARIDSVLTSHFFLSNTYETNIVSPTLVSQSSNTHEEHIHSTSSISPLRHSSFLPSLSTQPPILQLFLSLPEIHCSGGLQGLQNLHHTYRISCVHIVNRLQPKRLLIGVI